MVLKNILFINNKPELFKDEICFLEKEGYTITPVTTGNEALKILGELKNHFSIILLDPFMESIDKGINIARKINNTFHIPLLFYSDRAQDVLLAETNGISSYGSVAKSSGSANLKKIIDKIDSNNSTEDILSENENDIKKINLKWNTIFSNAAWGIVIGGATSKTLDMMNPAYAKMHGYSVRELLGKPVIEVFAPEGRAAVPGHMKIAHEKGYHRFESMHIKKDGTRFPALMDVTTIKDPTGKPLYRAVNVLDITKRKQQEQELKESKEYAEKLIHNSPFAVYSVDRNCRIVDFNKKAEEITGYSKEELVGKEFNMFAEEIKTVEKVGREYKIITKDKKEKIIERYNTFLYDDKGDVIGDIESFIDITNWKELMDFKSDIERIIRHDLKTPLNSIIGFPKMMLTDETLSDEHKEYLMIILSAGQNMLNLINASLNLYKLEEGTFQFNMAETNVISIVKQITVELRQIVMQKKSRIRLLIDNNPLKPDSVFKINSEKSLLYMILTNLIKNALEASPKEDEITINLSMKNKVLITIHNNGVIPEKIRDTFFEKYVTSGKISGNGLGTYSARLMADAISAEIYFDSDETSGTTLFLEFKNS